MRTVHKQILMITDKQTIEVEEGSDFLSVAMQNGNICLWYSCTLDQPKIERKIYIHGTGHQIIDAMAQFIGTVMPNEDLVFHIFYGGYTRFGEK